MRKPADWYPWAWYPWAWGRGGGVNLLSRYFAVGFRDFRACLRYGVVRDWALRHRLLTRAARIKASRRDALASRFGLVLGRGLVALARAGGVGAAGFFA